MHREIKMFKIDKEFLEPKREVSTNLDEMFMAIAYAAASNSVDPSTQVGSCYVSKDNKVLSVGRNGAPSGWDEDEFPWGTKKEYGIKNMKYTYVEHAEMNGLTNYVGSKREFEGGTIYVTLFPCTQCAKLIASLGVKKVRYDEARENCDDYECACILLDKAGIEYIRFSELTNNNADGIDISFSVGEKEGIKIRKRGTIKNTI